MGVDINESQGQTSNRNPYISDSTILKKKYKSIQMYILIMNSGRQTHKMSSSVCHSSASADFSVFGRLPTPLLHLRDDGLAEVIQSQIAVTNVHPALNVVADREIVFRRLTNVRRGKIEFRLQF